MIDCGVVDLLTQTDSLESVAGSLDTDLSSPDFP
jgi:hypothetical protein